ncbi:hypothetical protein TWF481_010765 [Arthrobotrys musiformis]|uniref:F-box domain-containing protein n=1 Tax=Arthrobotrys musiformis TaxID=47236 RepID=A0AAV9W3V8_9PEZI
MGSETNIYSLPAELHTQILEYLSDDIVYQIVASSILPQWRDITRESSRIQRRRYTRFHSAWQNAVAIHRALGETSDSGSFALCCMVRNKDIETYGLMWALRNPSEDRWNDNIPHSWCEIDITDSFILEEHFLLPFRGTLAQDLKLPDEDVSVSKSHVDSDLRTSFIKVSIRRFDTPQRHTVIRSMSIFPSHLEDMTMRSLLKYIVRHADRSLRAAGFDISKSHQMQIWPGSDIGVSVSIS